MPHGSHGRRGAADGAGKHRAIDEALRVLGASGLAFVGDDVTDEEVFRAFPQHLTVAVMDPPRASAATYYLRAPRETAAMLGAIATSRASRLG